MRFHWKVILAGAAAAVVGLALWAGNPLKNPKVVQELGLSPDQVQKLDDLKYQHERQMIDLRRDLALKRLELKRELEKDNPDRAAVDKLTDEESALQGQARRLRADHLLDARKVMTPEQWQKARQMFKQHMLNDGGRLRNRRNDGGGRNHGYVPRQGRNPAAGGPPSQAPGGASFQGAPDQQGPSPADMTEEIGSEPDGYLAEGF